MADNDAIKYSDLVSPDNSITELIKQLDELSDTYTNALKNIRTEAIQLTKELEKVSGATEDGRKKTKKSADDADRLARAQKELAFAESETAKKIAELNLAKTEANQINKLVIKLNQSAEGSYNRLSAQYSLNKIYLNNMTKAEREEAEAKEGLITKTRELYKAMNEYQKSTGKTNLNVGNYTEASDAIISYADRLKEALGLNNAFGESLLALGRGGNESKEVFAAMSDGAKALGNTLMSLMTNPVFLAIAGIAGAGVAFKFWYDYNAGLVEATRLTQQFTGKSGDDLKAFRNQVQAVADTFNADFKETLISANALAKQFGISADEAIQLIQDGFIAGGDANGEFLNTLKEYPAYFKEAGISASQFVAIVAETNKAGIFSDKGVDAIKEGNLRLREMTTATAAALDGIGISSTQVQKDLQTGAKTTFQVMQEVSAKLSELPDSAQSVGTAIADIFGGPGEDAGLQYLRTLKDISTDLDTVKSKAGELGRLQEEQLQSEIELQNALAGLFDATGGSFEGFTTSIKVFINQGLTALIKGVVSLINYFIELYNESNLFRAFVVALPEVFKTVFNTIGNLFGALIDMIQAAGKIFKSAFSLDWDGVKEGFTEFGTAFSDLINKEIKDVAESLNNGINRMQKKIPPLTIPVNVGTPDTSTKTTAAVTTKTPSVKTGGTDTNKQAKQVEAAYKRNLEATRKLQDAQLQLEADEWEKRRKQTEYQYKRQIEDLTHQLETEKSITESEKETINATILVLEQRLTNDLLKIEQQRQLQELQLQKQSIELRLQAIKAGTQEEKALRLELLENERQTAQLQNQQKPAGQRQDTGAINAGFDTQRTALIQEYADKQIQAELRIFDQRQALAQSEFDLLKTTEEKKTQFRLQAEKDRLNKILELNQQASVKMSDVEVQTIENQIERINQQIEESKKKDKTQDIYSILGLNLNDDQKEAINTSVSYAIEALNTLAQAKVDAANRAVEAAQKEVESAQTALEAELQARANGYASNVAYAQKELEDAKKNEQKALKEQQKAQRQQQAIDTAQQISSLVTATALIWRQLGIWGAIPAIAVMWGSFAASKIKAAQMAKNSGTETYGEGTVELLQGGSHQSGNDIDLGQKPDGTRRRAEGGEFFAVINKRNSRRFRRYIPDVINSMNNGTFAHKYLNAYKGADLISIGASSGADLSKLERDVNAIKKQGERRTYLDKDGRIIIEYKNLTRKLR